MKVKTMLPVVLAILATAGYCMPRPEPSLLSDSDLARIKGKQCSGYCELEDQNNWNYICSPEGSLECTTGSSCPGSGWRPSDYILRTVRQAASYTGKDVVSQQAVCTRLYDEVSNGDPYGLLCTGHMPTPPRVLAYNTCEAAQPTDHCQKCKWDDGPFGYNTATDTWCE